MNLHFFLTFILMFKKKMMSITYMTCLQGTQRTKKKKKILSKIADGEILPMIWFIFILTFSFLLLTVIKLKYGEQCMFLKYFRKEENRKQQQ